MQTAILCWWELALACATQHPPHSSILHTNVPQASSHTANVQMRCLVIYSTYTFDTSAKYPVKQQLEPVLLGTCHCVQKSLTLNQRAAKLVLNTEIYLSYLCAKQGSTPNHSEEEEGTLRNFCQWPGASEQTVKFQQCEKVVLFTTALCKSDRADNGYNRVDQHNIQFRHLYHNEPMYKSHGDNSSKVSGTCPTQPNY